MTVRLSRPARVAAVEYFVLCAAGFALMSAVLWLTDSTWLALIAAGMPLLVSLLDQYHRKSHLNPDFLIIHPEKTWKLGTFSGNAAQTSLIKAQSVQGHEGQQLQSVRLIQRWQHFLGLTLSLKIQNQPHNKSEIIVTTIWHCNMPADAYRRLCVMVAWQVDQPNKVQDPETV